MECCSRGPNPGHEKCALERTFRHPNTHRDVLLNPKVIIEVLSPSTEAFDRGGKFLRYQTWNPTLTDYVLVSQAFPIIEHFIRRDDGSWSYYIYQGIDQQLSIASIGCTLYLADVYDRVVFPTENDEPQDEELPS